MFPHTLVIAEDNSKVTVVDHFLSNDQFGQFACGANDLYAGHGAKITYTAAQCWSLESLSMQFNSTVVRRDARVQSLNLHLGAKQARHESLSQLQAPGGFSEMLALTVASGPASSTRGRSRSTRPPTPSRTSSTRTPSSTSRARSSRASSSWTRTRRRRTPTRATGT